MDLQGLVRRQMKVRNTFDAFLENIIEEHERQTNDRNRDFVDGLLAISQDNDTDIKVTRESVKANILEMLAAGTDTSSGTLEWGMSALLKNPWVMTKVQEELKKLIGLNRMVRESDQPHLQYLRAVVKETLRLYPPVPLLVPRESMETCTVSGYEIPAKARVIVNAWAIGRDPKTWEDAEMFKPERFIGSCIDVRGQNFELIPFGGGRRICPGMQLGTTVVELALAQLLHCFNWRLPDGMKGDDLDMSEQYGLTMPRAVQLLAVPIRRLPIEWMTFGRKYAVDSLVGGGFRALLKEYFFLLGAFNIGDFIPCLERMDLQGLNRRQMKVHRTFDAFLENIIEEHERQSNGVNRDFVDGLLALVQDNDMEIQVTRDNIKANILEMLVAGTDTSSGVLEWGMCALLKNPSVMKKAQEELEKVIGLNRIVHESDLPHLHYLQLVVKEILRLYPPAPLLGPHESMETCSVSGYEIPAKARIIINAWAIGRDPKLWEDAEMFKPERFIGSSIDVKGQNFELIPFGSGRRMCPGIQLATIVTQFALAQLLHCFDWRLPDGMNADDLEMIEEYGLTVAKAVPLHAVPALRLAMDRQI